MAGAAMHDQRAASRGQLEAKRAGMGGFRAGALWRRRRVDDDARPARNQPRVAHAGCCVRNRSDTGIRKRLIQSAGKTAPPAVTANQSTITMAECPQRRRNPGDRLHMLDAGRVAGIIERIGSPIEQHQNLEKIFGIP